MAKHWPFEPGMVSARAGKRISGTRYQASRLAPADDKSKTDNRLPRRGLQDTSSNSINKNQRSSSPIASKPTSGGGVGGSKRTPTNDAINQAQKPTFPRIGKGSKGNVPRKLRGTRSNPSGPMYGGPNGRP